MLRKTGAQKKSTCASARRPSWGPAFYGIDTPESRELIATRMSVKRIREYLNVDSLSYLSLEGMLSAAGGAPSRYCTACFNTRYPIPVQDGGRCR
jgi:amidophosphoribosyltransferase